MAQPLPSHKPKTPADLLAELTQNPDCLALWQFLPPSHRAEYLKYIDEAKKPETRIRRISRTLEMLQAKG